MEVSVVVVVICPPAQFPPQYPQIAEKYTVQQIAHSFKTREDLYSASPARPGGFLR
jgi:hypothetical protein